MIPPILQIYAALLHDQLLGKSVLGVPARGDPRNDDLGQGFGLDLLVHRSQAGALAGLHRRAERHTAFVGGHLAQGIDVKDLCDSVAGANEDTDLVFHEITLPR